MTGVGVRVQQGDVPVRSVGCLLDSETAAVFEIYTGRAVRNTLVSTQGKGTISLWLVDDDNPFAGPFSPTTTQVIFSPFPGGFSEWEAVIQSRPITYRVWVAFYAQINRYEIWDDGKGEPF